MLLLCIPYCHPCFPNDGHQFPRPQIQILMAIDVTHTPQFGRQKYIFVTIGTCSRIICVTAQTCENSKRLIHHICSPTLPSWAMPTSPQLTYMSPMSLLLPPGQSLSMSILFNRKINLRNTSKLPFTSYNTSNILPLTTSTNSSQCFFCASLSQPLLAAVPINIPLHDLHGTLPTRKAQNILLFDLLPPPLPCRTLLKTPSYMCHTHSPLHELLYPAGPEIFVESRQYTGPHKYFQLISGFSKHY